MFPERTKELAASVLDGARKAGIRVTTVETVTSGLVAAALAVVLKSYMIRKASC